MLAQVYRFFPDGERFCRESGGNWKKIGDPIYSRLAAGKADLNSVVVAVAEAELTLNTVVAVRNKVIESYREILRMPI